MTSAQVDVVTGAFSYSGAAIARELRDAGRAVRTLTGHPERAPAGTPLAVAPLDFTDPAGLVRALHGAHTLYNTYWVRFARGAIDHQAAIANSRILFAAAAQAGVQRIVHVSITHPSPDSPYPYFRGKARVEQILAECGVPYAIARPAIEQGFDRQIEPILRSFFYLPFRHSEDLTDQDYSLALSAEAGEADGLKWAALHRDIIVRFGRFPHRNRALGRATTPEEQEFLDEGGFAG